MHYKNIMFGFMSIAKRIGVRARKSVSIEKPFYLCVCECVIIFAVLNRKAIERQTKSHLHRKWYLIDAQFTISINYIVVGR